MLSPNPPSQPPSRPTTPSPSPASATSSRQRASAGIFAHRSPAELARDRGWKPGPPLLIIPGFMSSGLVIRESQLRPDWEGERVWISLQKLGFPVPDMERRFIARGDRPPSPTPARPRQSAEAPAATVSVAPAPAAPPTAPTAPTPPTSDADDPWISPDVEYNPKAISAENFYENDGEDWGADGDPDEPLPKRPARVTKVPPTPSQAAEANKTVYSMWLRHIVLDPSCLVNPRAVEDGGNGRVRVEAIDGFEGVDFLEPGFLTAAVTYVFAPVLEELKKLGYTEKNMTAAPYDWRLPPYILEQRYQYFSRCAEMVTQLRKANHGRKVAILGHSMGCRMAHYFATWAGRQPHLGSKWLEENVHSIIAAGGPFLGAAKSLRTVLTGDSMGLPGLDDREQVFMSRQMGSPPFLFPNPGWGKLSPFLSKDTFCFARVESHFQVTIHSTSFFGHVQRPRPPKAGSRLYVDVTWRNKTRYSEMAHVVGLTAKAATSSVRAAESARKVADVPRKAPDSKAEKPAKESRPIPGDVTATWKVPQVYQLTVEPPGMISPHQPAVVAFDVRASELMGAGYGVAELDLTALLGEAVGDFSKLREGEPVSFLKEVKFDLYGHMEFPFIMETPEIPIIAGPQGSAIPEVRATLLRKAMTAAALGKSTAVEVGSTTDLHLGLAAKDPGGLAGPVNPGSDAAKPPGPLPNGGAGNQPASRQFSFPSFTLSSMVLVGSITISATFTPQRVSPADLQVTKGPTEKYFYRGMNADQALRMDGATIMADIAKDFEEDPCFGLPDGSRKSAQPEYMRSPPGIRHWHLIYGTSRTTEIGCFLRRRTVYRLEVGPQAEPWRMFKLDEEGQLPGFRCSGGIAYESRGNRQIDPESGMPRTTSGDGTVAFQSLRYPMVWRRQGVNVTHDEIPDAEHRAMLADERFMEHLIRYIAARPLIENPVHFSPTERIGRFANRVSGQFSDWSDRASVAIEEIKEFSKRGIRSSSVH